MKQIKPNEISSIVFDNIAGGFFLNTSNGTQDNTMVIGWGGLQFMHGRQCFLVPVRPSRHTYKLLNENGYFTISIPLHNMIEQIKFAGTQSGRDVDKWQGHGLSKAPAQIVNVPIVAECELHIECKVISYADMREEALDEDTRRRCYPYGDLHRFYMGEILTCYYSK